MDNSEQGSAGWFAARCGKPTASRFADILAKTKSGASASRANYLAQLVCERLTGTPEESYSNAAMQRGTDLEPIARAKYIVASGAFVEEAGFIQHETLEAGASPDGLIDLDGGLEIKCPGKAAHLEYLKLETCPAKYVAQVQGGMWITGRAWWDFVSYHPEFPEWLQLKIIRVPRDDEYIKTLESEVTKFLEEVSAEVWNLDLLKKN